MTEVTAAKLRQRNRRKRIQISQIEKAIAVKQLLENPKLQYRSFRDRYVTQIPISSSARKASIKIKTMTPTYRDERVFSYLRDIPSKSLPWKFEVVVDFLAAESAGDDKQVERMMHTLSRLSARSQAGQATMETRFVDPQRLERYDDKFKQRVSTKARL